MSENGLPTAITHSATFSFDESPHGITGRPVAVDLQQREIGPRIDADDLRLDVAMIADRHRHLRHVVADHVVVGDDVAVGRDDDARAEALLGAAAPEHLALIAEEVLEERIVGERRGRSAHDLHRRNVGDGAHGLRGDAREVRAARRRGARAACSAAPPALDARRSAAPRDDLRLIGRAAREDDAERRRLRCSRLIMEQLFNTLVGTACLRTTTTRRGRFDRQLRHRDRQHAVGEVGGDAFGVDRLRQHERAHELAVAALDLVILLARDARFAAALQRQPVVVHVDAHLLARQARELGGEDERVGRFAEIDGRRPALRAVRRQALEADAGCGSDRGTGPSAQRPRFKHRSTAGPAGRVVR